MLSALQWNRTPPLHLYAAQAKLCHTLSTVRFSDAQVRQKLVGKGDPTYSQYTCYTGIADFTPPDIDTVGYRVFLGNGRYFVSSDVGGGKMQWYGFHKEPQGEFTFLCCGKPCPCKMSDKNPAYVLCSLVKMAGDVGLVWSIASCAHDCRH